MASEDSSSGSDFSIRPENALVAENLYLGPYWSTETLREASITLIISFYAGIVLTKVGPDGNLGNRNHCGLNDDPNYLQWFHRLCSAIESHIDHEENILLYFREDENHTDEDLSRAITLEEAWRIWRGEEKRKKRKQSRRYILKHHREQLRVWSAIMHAKDDEQRAIIYMAWEEDLSENRPWRAKGLKVSHRTAAFFRGLF